MKIFERFGRKPVRKPPEEIAALIEGFANGTGGKWDWDCFISTHFEDERIDWAQKERMFQGRARISACWKVWLV